MCTFLRGLRDRFFVPVFESLTAMDNQHKQIVAEIQHNSEQIMAEIQHNSEQLDKIVAHRQDAETDAIYAYRFLLNREPENEQIVFDNQKHWTELRCDLMESEEYKALTPPPCVCARSQHYTPSIRHIKRTRTLHATS